MVILVAKKLFMVKEKVCLIVVGNVSFLQTAELTPSGMWTSRILAGLKESLYITERIILYGVGIFF